MKQKKVFLSLAASAMIAAGFTSCSIDDNPIYQGSTPKPVVDTFDEGSEIQNGSCEGSLADNFVCHEWRTSAKQFDGEANIVIDPEDRDNHCVAVVVRSKEEAKAAGNATVTNGQPLADDFSNFADWDSQFFITMGAEKALKAKDKIRLTMRVKADVAQDGVATQSHAAPGAYIHWYCVDNVNFTTEWTEFTKEVEVGGKDSNGNFSWGKAADGMFTIAFNLAKGGHNTYYFDDIRIEVVRYDPLDEGNAIKGGSFEYIKESDAFWCHEWRTSDKQTDGKANIIVDPANPKNHCAAVVIRSKEEAKAAGNATLTNNQPLADDFSNFADWDSQFFISVGENQALKAGDKIQLKMKIKADKAQSAATQSHKAPGAYIHWYGVGDVNFTTEWTNFDSGEIEVKDGAGYGNAAAGLYTIAFNLAKGIHNTVYFDDVQVIITKKE